MRPSERTGVLVLRVWIEPGGEDGLRARITASDDLERAEQRSVAAASVDDVVRVVREFVERFVEQGVE